MDYGMWHDDYSPHAMAGFAAVASLFWLHSLTAPIAVFLALWTLIWCCDRLGKAARKQFNNEVSRFQMTFGPPFGSALAFGFWQGEISAFFFAITVLMFFVFCSERVYREATRDIAQAALESEINQATADRR